jgi:hypothetical protein
VPKAIEDGMLHVLTADDWYMKGGPFGAARMYGLVQEALAELRKKGRRARGAGVMDWALHGGADTRELMEYESRVNFRSRRLGGSGKFRKFRVRFIEVPCQVRRKAWKVWKSGVRFVEFRYARRTRIQRT